MVFSEFIPRFGGRDSEVDESIWGRHFYKGARNAEEALNYNDAAVCSALKRLECPPDDKPWVLSMPLIFPHCPFQVEEPYYSMYNRSKLEQPAFDSNMRTGYEPQCMKTIQERYGTTRATPEM